MPEQMAGLYHAGSVGIIMSGWLGAMNYGVIVANDVDAYLLKAAASPKLRSRLPCHEPRRNSRGHSASPAVSAAG